MNKVVAIVGMPGSGKSETTKIFQKEGFHIVYFGGITIEKLKELGLEINEANERVVREKLRKEHGMDAYAKLNLPKINKALKTSNVVIDGLYSYEEYTYLKEKLGDKFILISVHASPEIRYRRLGERTVRPLTVAECKSREHAELKNLNKGATIAMADFVVVNEGSLSALKKEIDAILKEIGR